MVQNGMIQYSVVQRRARNFSRKDNAKPELTEIKGFYLALISKEKHHSDSLSKWTENNQIDGKCQAWLLNKQRPKMVSIFNETWNKTEGSPQTFTFQDVQLQSY